jgi:tetratricopeptide (TPR) repeat protein
VPKARTLRFRRKKKPSPEALDALARAYYQFEEERRVAADGSLDALFEKTPTEKLPELVENPLLRSIGAIVYLGGVFGDLLVTDPKRAKALAELEVSLAENLHSNAYGAIAVVQARCYAWRDLGIAFRALGQLHASLDAFAAAERDLPEYGALAHDLAIVHLSVALTLQEVERFDEARALLAESKAVFIDHGDDKRLVLAISAEGVLLQRMKNFREARETYLLLLHSSAEMESGVIAAVHRGIGLCSLELGEFVDAETNLVRAIALNQQFGQDIEVIRGKAALGRLLVRRGHSAEAVAYLRPVRREFLRHGLTEEAGICGLEIVEGMLALQNFSAAEPLARKIIAEFTRAGLNKRAITALGYLQEAIASSKASARLASTIRDYIVSLRTSPERDFLPHALTASPDRPREP